MKSLPLDVITNNLYKNHHFAICIDPKHTIKNYHYTIWCLEDIEDITKITEDIIDKLDNFIRIIQEQNFYDNEKMYFCYPPVFKRLHLHIVNNDYISYRPLNEVYIYNNVFKDNLYKINKINKEKVDANRLELRFNIGIIILSDINKITTLAEIKQKQQLDYIICIRRDHEGLINNLLTNHKLIDEHLISNNLNNYSFFIKYNFLIEL